MGWLALAVLMVVAFAGARLTGLPRAAGSAMAAALMAGATGYALQQSASLPSHPVRAGADAVEVDPGLVAFRTAILPGATAELAAADDRLRAGDTVGAANGLLAAIARAPENAALWTGLGGAFVAHDEGRMSPAAGLAFRQAARFAPRAPGPPFFLGLAYVQGGDLAAAKTAWLHALALAPRDAAYRVDIAERLVLIDDFQAMAARAGPAR